jgi:toxin ParE1/3/4
MGYRLLPTAESELDDIWFYVARASGSIDIANRVIDAITESLFSIGQYPQIGRRRDDDLRPNLRSFPSGEYVIIYRVDGGDALILHVMRGSRDIESLLD